MGTGAPAVGAAATAGELADAAGAAAGAAPASAGTSMPKARFASRDRLSRCSGISVNVAPTAYFGEILLSEAAQLITTEIATEFTTGTATTETVNWTRFGANTDCRPTARTTNNSPVDKAEISSGFL